MKNKPKPPAIFSRSLALIDDAICEAIQDAIQHPKLARGQVWCRTCGRTERVDSAECMRSGWPKCCGSTMTVDAPAERQKIMPQKSGGA